MIRITMARQDTRHPDRRKRHQGRASCEVAGRRFETEGPAPIYRMLTLIWLHGHGGERFEVHDNISPTGKPGGLAMTGRVRNWALISNGRPMFMKDAKPDPSFTPQERESTARAAGQVIELTEKDSSRPYKARTGETRPSDSPEHPRDGEGTSTRNSTARTPEAA
jgi:hypothetical protein